MDGVERLSVTQVLGPQKILGPQKQIWPPIYYAPDQFKIACSCRMQWNENDFGGVKVLRINPGDIWVPDIEVYNTKVAPYNSRARC